MDIGTASQNQGARSPTAAPASPDAATPFVSTPWLAGYQPLPDAYDECVDETGAIRPAWKAASTLWTTRNGSQQLAERQAADRYLRDNGVAHRVYGGDHSQERPWPLSHLPLILDAREWATLEQGLIQRANLLEALLADLYGPQTLVRDGHVPAALIAGAPGFLRPLVGATPAHTHRLHFIAIELGRGPDGRWWVLGDRTQAPSGAGYALENRLATSRAMGSDLRQLQVSRLAGFFQGFREALGAMTGNESARVGLLSPGPFNQTYYEQAFLARYLGFLLLEGGDLIMRDNLLYVRTVRGLKRLDVLWRRLDADFCDPLELRAESRLGVPGLVQAVRAGGLTCVNDLGSGLLESRAFMAFMPALARTVLGEDLALPNIATWWLGNPPMQAQAALAGGSTVRLSAFGTGLPMEDLPLDETGLTNALPQDQVIQEAVRLSTMPTLIGVGAGGGSSEGATMALRPRPFSLRVFLARTKSGWQVMPGGFCRVADTDDTRALSMQAGSRSADVWVRSETPVQPVSLLTSGGERKVRRVPGTLPARAADNLFWLGRYTERAQSALRLARAYLVRRADGYGTDDALLSAMQAQLKRWDIDDPDAPALFADHLMPNLENARRAASAIRDRFSPDAWQSLNGFVRRASGGELQALSTTEQINEALMMLAAFAGLVGENMVRLSGWRFLEIGRRMERALASCQLAERFAFAEPARAPLPAGSYDLLLELADSVMSYRQRYSVTTDRTTVVDLIVLDPNNPRSLAFQLQRINTHIDEITDHRAFDQQTELQRLSFSMWSRIHTLRAYELNRSHLTLIQNGLLKLSGELTSSFIAPGETLATVQI